MEFDNGAPGRRSERELLEKIKGGKGQEREDAWTELYRRYHPEIRRFLKGKIKSEADAKNIFGDVWKEALKKLPDFEWREDDPPKTETPVKSWLYRTAELKCLAYFRKQKRRHEVIADLSNKEHRSSRNDPDPDTPSENSAPCARHARRMRCYKLYLPYALSRLKAENKEILRLRACEDKNFEEIGEIFGLKPGTVRQRYRRTRNSLKVTLLELAALKAELCDKYLEIEKMIEKSLTPEAGEIIHLLFFEKKSRQEIGSLLGLEPETVQQRRKQSVIKLYEILLEFKRGVVRQAYGPRITQLIPSLGPEQDQELFRRCCFEREDCTKIGKQLGIAPETVRQTCTRALIKLHNLLEE